jgi:hypothetical protein
MDASFPEILFILHSHDSCRPSGDCGGSRDRTQSSLSTDLEGMYRGGFERNKRGEKIFVIKQKMASSFAIFL